MKKIIIKLAAIILISGLNSCQNERSDSTQNQNVVEKKVGSLTFKQIHDNKETQKITKFISESKLALNKFQSKAGDIDFDFNNLELVKNDATNNFAIVAKQTNYDIHGNNYAIGFIEDEKNHEIFSSVIVKTSEVSETLKNVEYYDLEGNLLLSVDINTVTKLFDIKYLTPNNSSKLCSGSQTAHCMSNAYSNSGWFSVGLTIATAFEPGCSVAVAAGCALSC